MGSERSPNLNTPMDNITLPAWIGKALYAIAIAALLGTGSTVIGSAKDVAVLQSDQTHVEESLSRIESKLDRVIEQEHPRVASQ